LLRLELASVLPLLAGVGKRFAPFLQGPLGAFVARPELAGFVRQSGMVGARADTGALVEMLKGMAACDLRTLLATFEAVAGDPAPELLDGLTSPVLAVMGDRDQFTSRAVVEEMVARVPAGRLEMYHGATHYLPLEFPDRLAAHGVHGPQISRLHREGTVTTDDGSMGHRGIVTDVMPSVMGRTKTQVVYACGPNPMLRAVSEYSASRGVPCQVAVEELMACGLGVCWTCVVPIRAKDARIRMRRSCLDGPVFNGAKVAWVATPVSRTRGSSMTRNRATARPGVRSTTM
jgi:hypothetical protein